MQAKQVVIPLEADLVLTLKKCKIHKFSSKKKDRIVTGTSSVM